MKKLKVGLVLLAAYTLSVSLVLAAAFVVRTPDHPTVLVQSEVQMANIGGGGR
jgi:hypothetical protein